MVFPLVEWRAFIVCHSIIREAKSAQLFERVEWELLT